MGGGKRQTWRELLDAGELVLLPSAHDGLTAKLIEQAGFRAFQVGGFSVVGARFGLPDIDLAQFGELSTRPRHRWKVQRVANTYTDGWPAQPSGV